MKTKTLAITLVLALLSSAVVGTPLIKYVSADPVIFTEFPITVTIVSPEDGTTFTDNYFILECSVTDIPLEEFAPDLTSVTFYLKVTLGDNYTTYPVTYSLSNPPSFHRSINVTNVPDGQHSLQVTAFYSIMPSGHHMTEIKGSSEPIHLTIKTNSPPVINVLSIENKNYNTSRIPLNLTTSEPVQQITYCVDGKENVTISGNITLTGLSDGEHNLTVYATDLAGNVGASKVIFFSIAESKPFPTTLIVASIVIVVGVGVLVYFKKRKH